MNTAAPPADEVPEFAALPEWVVFSCDGQLFGVPLLSTREVVPPQPLTRLPGCGPEVAGLIGLRGRVITVFDMGVVLGREPALRLPEHRIIVLDFDLRVAAIAVDYIAEIARDAAAVLETAGDVAVPAAVQTDLVGVGRLDDRPYYALDPNGILGRLLT